MKLREDILNVLLYDKNFDRDDKLKCLKKEQKLSS